jgi:ankyrin repeat protein
MHGHVRATQALLQGGAEVDATASGTRIKAFPVSTSGYVDVEGVTPLLAAAENGHFDVVRLLVEAGADVNHADSSGFTPLMGAARAGHSGMAKFLMERGARPDAVDKSGKTAASHAAEFVLQQRAQRHDG